MSWFKPTGNRLLAFQVVAHLSIIPMVMYATWWQWLIALAMYALNAVSFTVIMHRFVAHNAFKCSKWVERLLVIHSTICAPTTSAISWLAIHSKHHRYTDTEKDPHSPLHKGFWGVWLLMLAEVEIRFAARLIRKPLYRIQHDYFFAGILLYAAILFVLSPFAVMYAFLCPAAMYWTATACLNYFAHDKKAATARNVNVLKVLLFGEGYHHNHHLSPDAKRFGKYDMGYYAIRLIEKKDPT